MDNCAKCEGTLTPENRIMVVTRDEEFCSPECMYDFLDEERGVIASVPLDVPK